LAIRCDGVLKWSGYFRLTDKQAQLVDVYAADDWY